MIINNDKFVDNISLGNDNNVNKSKKSKNVKNKQLLKEYVSGNPKYRLPRGIFSAHIIGDHNQVFRYKSPN